MKFSWMALAVTVLIVVIGGLVSYLEGTFSRKQGKKMHMAFLHNWAISFGDLALFPFINALIILWILGYRWYTYAACLCIGLVVTWIEHRAWWRHDENLGHVFANWNGASWMEDLTKAGWIHFIYMVLQVTVLALFVITPIKDQQTVLAVVYLFSLFLVVQNGQAFYIQGSLNKKVAIFEAIAIIVVTAIKLTGRL